MERVHWFLQILFSLGALKQAFAFKMSLDDLKTQEILQELLSKKHSGCEFTIKNEIAMNFQTVVDF